MAVNYEHEHELKIGGLGRRFRLSATLTFVTNCFLESFVTIVPIVSEDGALSSHRGNDCIVGMNL